MPSIKDFIRSSVVFVAMMAVLSGFMILNGMFWGGMI